jgi:enolase-phosphatase E1
MRALLLDIEGTTTPVEFVYDVLFPFARAHLKEFLLKHQGTDELRNDIGRLRIDHAVDQEQQLNPPPWHDDSIDSQIESVVAYVRWLMDRDRKSTALKSLQGKIWHQGYLSGKLFGQVYSDVAVAFSRWHTQGKDIYIYSSGSTLAQKLLFANTVEGDLTHFIRGYFDTTTGPKTESESYRRIANAIQQPRQEILFLSDSVTELNVALKAGLSTALCFRSGRPKPESVVHPIIYSFDEISP